MPNTPNDFCAVIKPVEKGWISVPHLMAHGYSFVRVGEKTHLCRAGRLICTQQTGGQNWVKALFTNKIKRQRICRTCYKLLCQHDEQVRQMPFNFNG